MRSPPVKTTLGNLGLDVSTPDGNYRIHLWFRGQMRYSYPFDDAPRTELTFGANWFFSRHDNKITFDLSRLTLELPGEETSSENRVRVQWDISF